MGLCPPTHTHTLPGEALRGQTPLGLSLGCQEGWGLAVSKPALPAAQWWRLARSRSTSSIVNSW